MELLLYNESNSHHHGKLSFGHFDYTTGRSVSGNEFIQGSQYANLTPKTTCGQFEYQLEGEYLAITKDKQYAALPTAQDIRICEATEKISLSHEPSTLSS